LQAALAARKARAASSNEHLVKTALFNIKWDIA
jgi:hypothetical protein